MISSKKAMEAAQVVADFCREQPGCQNCIFRKYGSDSWKCYISSYFLQDVIANTEAKKKNGGYL